VTEHFVTDRELEEYKSLRATIARRGTVRIAALVGGIAAWAITTIAVASLAIPLLSVIPLLLLAATFEAVFSQHVSVERIGRYLQVFHEDRWEATAMSFGHPLAGTGADPLFGVLFGAATMCNFVPVALGSPVAIELIVLGGAHSLFALRLAVARRAAARQRAADQARFEQIKNDNRPGNR
jgi:hypothetical protein